MQRYVVPNVTQHPPRRGHLRMGGCSSSGVEINATSQYITLGGHPVLPVMGEFHFSRHDSRFWEEELLKMKSGGIQIIASYLFWIHHEEEEGVFKWTGNCDVRRFIQLCAKHDLYSYPRIGPWVHGECRYGGHPDWIETRDMKRRSTDPAYLGPVRRFYEQIAAQLKGLYWKDGGPIIGIQLDNEYYKRGEGCGAEFFMALKSTAMEAGMDVPLWTVTGWSNPEVPHLEVIPVFGGYPDAFWIEHDESEVSPNYTFSPDRNDEQIGSDRGTVAGVNVPLEDYPYLTCEMGPGMQVSYHRRPYIHPPDCTAILVSKLGSGANLPGYYVYHGTTHPMGKLTRMNESSQCDYPNDTPVFSYDFQAPLGEFGQVRDGFYHYKPFHLFCEQFGPLLATMPPSFPVEVLADPLSRTQLRYACRSNGKTGFLFVNNHVRNHPMPAFEEVQFEVAMDGQAVTLPAHPVTIAEGNHFIWPVNMELGGAVLRSSTAQPLCILDEGATYVFAETEGFPIEYAFLSASIAACSADTVDQGEAKVVHIGEAGLGAQFTVTDQDGGEIRIITLNREQARHSFKEGDDFYISEETLILFDGPCLRVQGSAPSATFLRYAGEGAFTEHSIAFPEKEIELEITHVQDAADLDFPMEYNTQGRLIMPPDDAYDHGAVVRIQLPHNALDGVHDVLIRIHYKGDCARLFVGDCFVHDHFYNGRPWEIGLRYLPEEALTDGLTLKFLPMRKNAPIYLDEAFKIDFGGKEQVLEIETIEAIPIYEMKETSWTNPAP